MKDLTNQRFGKLVALRPTEMRDTARSTIWECKCDCGNVCYVSRNSLVRNLKQSCGCLQTSRQNDLAGKTFGWLTVLRKSDQRKNKKILWECKCECGNTVLVRGASLIKGETKSCGCRQDIKAKENYAKALRPAYVMGTNVDMLKSEKLRSTNTSGVKGVHYSARYNRYIATLMFRGVTLTKSCITLEEAASARAKMKQVHEEFIEWWDSLSEDEKLVANLEYEDNKDKLKAELKKRLGEI